MSRPVFTEDAALDAAAAARWHETQRAGRGAQFKQALAAALDAIGHQPDAYRVMDGDFRRFVLERFPYVLVYRQEARGVVIHAVFHTAQHPSRLTDRLRDA